MERPDFKHALGRLLGPAGPEVGCDECFEQLDLYVELELEARKTAKADDCGAGGRRPSAGATEGARQLLPVGTERHGVRKLATAAGERPHVRRS